MTVFPAQYFPGLPDHSHTRGVDRHQPMGILWGQSDQNPPGEDSQDQPSWQWLMPRPEGTGQEGQTWRAMELSDTPRPPM